MSSSDWLDFLLVAGLTALVLFFAASLVLLLAAKSRQRRQDAKAEAGRAQLSD